MEFLLPPGWPRPRGYSNGVVGWDEQERFLARDLAGQFRQILANTLAILAEGGAGPEHVVRMTWYVLDKEEYVAAYPAIGVAYRELIGRHFPAMTAVQVSGLMEDRARVEIEVTAIVP